ncbi:SDR family NAD(P)-dependent oxidoreductase [Blastococcus goldschmidtiae]|uniref:SDR family NAD(P)-dependent oxidoreductase n=1 Tax=Blastococcus goldschmidtiae TaxID=3075546 RepID=A0ABU2KCT7_9ACTN|nr:SDR family NAD(P)-dependent oxidoreductase [Blastococcus sp. DSM 46792]MDT0278014.1 SDR family NAD(P)-dependent oxidoreductase [Blastococcus sp. DSM 46792]
MRHVQLDQEVLVVVGAASGIGRTIALAAGAKVVAAARGEEGLRSLADEAGPGEVDVHVADVDDAQQLRDLAAFGSERFGCIDTWAHVAGVVSQKVMDVLAPATAFRLQRSHDPEAPTGRINLYGAVEGDDRVRGVVTRLHR